MTRMRSATASTSGRSEEITTTAVPPAARSKSNWWISALAPTSTPRVGSSTIRTAGDTRSHFARATFCWFPPLRRATGSSGPRQTIRSERQNATASACALRRSCRQPAPCRQSTAEDVVGDAHLEEESGLLAVLGQVADARPRSPRAGDLGSTRRPVTWTSPAYPGQPPKSPSASSVPPGADQAGQCDDLPASHLERDVPEPRPDPRCAPGVAQAADLQRDRRVGTGPVLPRPVWIEAAADHPGHEVSGCHLLRLGRSPRPSRP